MLKDFYPLMNNETLTAEFCNDLQTKPIYASVTPDRLKEFAATVWDYVTTLPAHAKYFTTDNPTWRDNAEKVRSNYISVVNELVHGTKTQLYNVSDTVKTFVNKFAGAVTELIKTANGCAHFSNRSQVSNGQKEAVERLINARITISPNPSDYLLPNVSFVSCDNLATSGAICQPMRVLQVDNISTHTIYDFVPLIILSVVLLFCSFAFYLIYKRALRHLKTDNDAIEMSEIVVGEDDKFLPH